jgi:hypothetical protein
MPNSSQSDSRLTPASAEAIPAATGGEATAVALGQLAGENVPQTDMPDNRRDVVDRRGRPIRSFLYGNFRPRRRAHRRGEDDHRFVFDWHEPRVLYLAVTILLLSCTDALFTLNLLTVGAEEANVLMNSLLEQGVDQFLMVKISLTAISLIFLVVAARRQFMGWFRVERLLHVVCAGYFGLIAYEIYLFNVIFELSIPLDRPTWVMLPG